MYSPTFWCFSSHWLIWEDWDYYNLSPNLLFFFIPFLLAILWEDWNCYNLSPNLLFLLHLFPHYFKAISTHNLITCITVSALSAFKKNSKFYYYIHPHHSYPIRWKKNDKLDDGSIRFTNQNGNSSSAYVKCTRY